ncbi:hypothetical protein KGQ20_14565 [Catenulispora sp. NF23]|uniref:hypothetical protein n=1 Tax=Catenulispora pinistramenti TaxID=2705254 RepID=UPI001BA5FC14|nr:hypothetical protein [Catenulispora pinistramenti]MBS2533995.1 hypothetical protein [Catenulispora pinistramenti]
MDLTLATRFSATAAAIGLVGGAFVALPAGVAAATAPAAHPAAHPGGYPAARPAAFTPPRADQGAVPAGSIPFSVADPDTAPRPVVTAEIGGVQLLLLLDTGSTGIRVAADKIPSSAVAVTGAARPYGYGSGIQLHGDQANADVVLAGYHTGPLPIELVRSTDCFADKPDCPAAHGAEPAMFGGVLDGIMGVSPEEISGLVNPLWGLQDPAGNHIGRQFAVRYDPAEVSGEILLNVPAAGYGLAQLPRTPPLNHQRSRPANPAKPPSWNPRAVQTCVEGTGLAKTCAPAMFDSGTPEFALNVPGAPAATWPAGRSLTVGVPQARWSATYGTGAGTGVTVTDAPSTDTSGTLIGLPAFAKGPIRFDLAAGTVGFPVPGASAGAAPAPQQRGLVQAAPAPAAAAAAAVQPAASQHAATAPRPAAPHRTTTKSARRQPSSRPFHKTGKKARSLPDTGVPLSAALGAVTALTALLAGIGTVLAARRRPDHKA